MTTPPQLWLDHLPAELWEQTADAHDLGQLENPLRDRVWTLRTAAHELGHRCELASGYRTPYQQYRLRLGRVPAGEEFNPLFRGDPPTATPGNSQHQRRRAADLDMQADGYEWLHAVADRFGLALTVPGERWHVEASGFGEVPLLTYPGPSFDDDHQEVPVALSDQDINRIALVTAATVDKVLAKRFAALGLPVIAGVDRILADDVAAIRADIAEVLAAEADDHGPA